MKLHILRHISCCTLLMLLLVACKEESVSTLGGYSPSDILTLGISSSQTWTSGVETKSEESVQGSVTRASEIRRTEALPMDVDGEIPLDTDIYMYLIEEDIPEEIEEVTDEPLTRAGEGEEKETEKPKSYGVYAYKGQDNNVTSTYMDNLFLDENVQYSGDRTYYWPGSSYWLRFFSYSPYIDMTAQGDKNPSISNGGAAPVITYRVPSEVSEQVDLLANSPLQHAGDYKQTVQLTLGHILSKVQVKLGTIAVGEIKSIIISGAKNKGTYTFSADENGIYWTSQKDGENTYTQEPIGEQARNSILGEPMYLMPQTLGDDVTIQINISVTSDDATVSNTTREHQYSISKKLNNFTTEWKSGKQYTYVISTPEEVDVEVNDEIEYVGGNPVKKNLEIKNTGLADACIRVSLVGAWYVDNNGQHLVVGEWKPNEDGSFDWGVAEPNTTSTNSRSWRKDANGFYYYMKKVSPGKTIDALFDSYTLTGKGPMANSYLELAIAVQAIHIDDAYLVWPEELQFWKAN